MRRTEALPREAALTATRRAAPSPPRSRTANFPVRRRCLPVRCGRSSPEPSGARPTHDAAEGNVKFIELDTARRDRDEGRENPRKVTLLPRSPRNPRGEAGRPRPPPARRSPCGGSLTPRTPARGRRAAAPRPLPPPPTPALPTATAPRPRSAPPRGVGGRGGCPPPPQPGRAVSGGARRVPLRRGCSVSLGRRAYSLRGAARRGAGGKRRDAEYTESAAGRRGDAASLRQRLTYGLHTSISTRGAARRPFPRASRARGPHLPGMPPVAAALALQGHAGSGEEAAGWEGLIAGLERAAGAGGRAPGRAGGREASRVRSGAGGQRGRGDGPPPPRSLPRRRGQTVPCMRIPQRL